MVLRRAFLFKFLAPFSNSFFPQVPTKIPTRPVVCSESELVAAQPPDLRPVQY